MKEQEAVALLRQEFERTPLMPTGGISVLPSVAIALCDELTLAYDRIEELVLLNDKGWQMVAANNQVADSHVDVLKEALRAVLVAAHGTADEAELARGECSDETHQTIRTALAQ